MDPHVLASTVDYFRTLAQTNRPLFLRIVWTVAGLAAVTVGVGVWLLVSVFSGLPDDAAIRAIGTTAQATTLYDAHDRPVSTIFKEQRIDVPLERVSPNLVKAILAIEDQRFYDHHGIDVVRIAGAAWMNLRDGWGAQGASTITQQLARQAVLSREKTLRRKLREVVVAARIEGTFSKDEILELYLNRVYFGDGLYGAEAASLGYFGKHASELGPAEAALLAGLVKAPSVNAPTVNLERAVSRRNAVLRAMRDHDDIDDATFEKAVKSTPRLVDALRREDAHGQYFKEEIRKQLVAQFGWDRVYEGGLKVYTTLDIDMQKAAEAEVTRAIADIEGRQARRGRKSSGSDPLQAALVALDPRTGEVRALVGGRSFEASRFNRVTQARRQPGSAFKPFVYAAALEAGYTPGSIISTVDAPIMTLQGAWVPDDHSTSDTMTMREALRSSSNRAAVSMLQTIGISAAARASQQLGIGDVPRVWSMALGSGEVTLMAMTSAYAAFANRGIVTEPTLLRRVESADGQVLFASSPHSERGVSESTAYLMTSMLSDVVNAGTAWQARNVGFTLPAAGKTGTTNDYKDAWFVGYTPSLATGVWVGYDQPRTIIGNGYAGDLAVPLWGRFMAVATKDAKPEGFKSPGNITGVTICRLTGKLATDACRRAALLDEDGGSSRRSPVYTEYFARGTEPTEYCEHGFRIPTTVAASGGAHEHVSPAAAAAQILTGGASSPAVPAVAAATVAPPAPAIVDAPREPDEAEPKKKRGFWSKVFGRGR